MTNTKIHLGRFQNPQDLRDSGSTTLTPMRLSSVHCQCTGLGEQTYVRTRTNATGNGPRRFQIWVATGLWSSRPGDHHAQTPTQTTLTALGKLASSLCYTLPGATEVPDMDLTSNRLFISVVFHPGVSRRRA